MFPQVPYELSHLKFKRIDQKKCFYYDDDKMCILKSYNTIVAMLDKRTNYLFIDRYKYSGYTSCHISYFWRAFLKAEPEKFLMVSQDHLIQSIKVILAGEQVTPNLKNKYNVGDYVTFYRLRKIAGKMGQIAEVINEYTYVDSEDYHTPFSYLVKFDEGYRYTEPKNLIPLKGGL